MAHLSGGNYHFSHKRKIFEVMKQCNGDGQPRFLSEKLGRRRKENLFLLLVHEKVTMSFN